MSTWKDSAKHLPEIGSQVIVKTNSGQTHYAVYSAFDEFDTHQPDYSPEYRKAWYKFSSRTVIKWKYFNLK